MAREYQIHHPKGKFINFDERKALQSKWNKNLDPNGYAKESMRSLAKKTGLPYETLRRELMRGWTYLPRKTPSGTQYDEYRAELAQQRANECAANKGPRQKMTNMIAEELRKVMSPKGTVSPETALKILHEKGIKTPCIRTVYTLIHQGVLGMDDSWLPVGREKRRKTGKVHPAASLARIKGNSIDDLPEPEKKRIVPGVWEMDTVVSCRKGKGGLLTLVECSTRYAIAVRIRRIGSRCVTRALRKLMKEGRFKVLRAIITDNGVEFLKHEKIKSILGIEVYYTDAYAAYEKGAIENINRLIRRWYPKRTDFSRVPPEDIQQMMDSINDISRRVSLKGLTANEAFSRVA